MTMTATAPPRTLAPLACTILTRTYLITKDRYLGAGREGQ